MSGTGAHSADRADGPPVEQTVPAEPPPPTEPALPAEPLAAEPIPAGDVAVPTGSDYQAETVVPGGPTPPPAADAFATGELGRAARRRLVEESARVDAHTSRRRALIVSGSVLGLLAAVVLIWFVLSRGSGDGGPAPAPTATATGPSQPTLLFQVKDTEGIAVDNALLSVGGPTGRANMIPIASATVVDVATGGTLPFGQIARLPDPDAASGALSDAIGVDVNATLAMDTLAFSGLVDAVGGVRADVDVDVTKDQPDGTKLILVPAGPSQLLQGPQAVAFATYLATGEPEEARMARFSQVLRLVIGQLPPDATKVEAIFNGLGASSKATVPTAQIAAFFVRMQADVAADDVVYRNLPVKPLDTGGPTAYRIDQEAAATMVAELLPDAARKPGPNSKVRVLVQNGVGSPGLNAAARQLLIGAGYTYVNGGNAGAFGQAATVIVVPDSTPESLAWGSEIATALGVPGTSVQVATSGQSVADVIVVLGADFRPTAA